MQRAARVLPITQPGSSREVAGSGAASRSCQVPEFACLLGADSDRSLLDFSDEDGSVITVPAEANSGQPAGRGLVVAGDPK